VQFIARLPRNVNEAVKEIERTQGWSEVAAYGPPHPQGVGPEVVTETYDPLWRALVEADSAACFHGGGSQFSTYNNWRTAKLEPVSHALTCMVDGQLAMAGMIFGGVLDRHPNLRVAFYESNAAWVPAWLCKMDDHAVGRQSRFIEGHKPRSKPSEIFREQCFVACDADEGDLGHAVEFLDGGNIIFNTDYPHGDSPMPGAVGMFLDQPISDEAKRKILWDNSLKLYGSRVNPSVAREAVTAA
jgi:predicted TIM-barrel fold metal-dependent hydrolase